MGPDRSGYTKTTQSTEDLMRRRRLCARRQDGADVRASTVASFVFGLVFGYPALKLVRNLVVSSRPSPSFS